MSKMIGHLRFIPTALIVAMVLPGCASMVSGSTSKTSIETDPAGANCEFYGHHYTHRGVAPLSVSLPAKAAPITIICAAEGYERSTVYLDTEADGWIFGNLLLGGAIGIMVDGASGAGQMYPDRVSLALQPEEFPDAAARDEWFDARKAAIEGRWDAEREAILAKCLRRATKDQCEHKADSIDSQRAKELADLEARRAAATIGSN